MALFDNANITDEDEDEDVKDVKCGWLMKVKVFFFDLKQIVKYILQLWNIYKTNLFLCKCFVKYCYI